MADGRVVSGFSARLGAVVAAVAVVVSGVVVVPTASVAGAGVVVSEGLLRVTTDPAVPSQISVDGVARDTWGLIWLKIATGSHEVCFSDVPGYATPSCESVTVTEGATTSVTGNFTQLGYLQVETSPALPSQIIVDGVPRDNWGLFTAMAPGTHEVCFGAVVDHVAPGCEDVKVFAGATATVTGTFTASTGAPGKTGVGMLRVTTTPAVGSQVSVDGVIRDTWGLNWLEITPGAHEVCFSEVPGYVSQDCESVTVSEGATTTVDGKFRQNGYLQVITDPPSPSTISVDGTPRDDWGMYTDMAPGDYEVCFGPVPGLVTPGCETVTITAGTTASTTGTFTPVTPPDGSIAAGNRHSCALRTDGTVSCWGKNYNGQLGDGTTTDSHVPVDVTGLVDAIAISAGDSHTCALRSGGTVSCWGFNAFGRLGDGTTTDSRVPVAVTGLSDVTAISAGGEHTCALRSGGTVSCWGYNAYGRLGDGTITTTYVPVGVSGLADATAINTGARHTCAVRVGGAVSCWGRNVYGQLGDGTTIDSSVPVGVTGLADATAIDGGTRHTCAVRVGGAVSCWGRNVHGQLGDGSTIDSSVPVGVTGLADATAVSAGYNHTCAVRAGGAVSCWGANTAGKLGDGTTTDSQVPVGVTGLGVATTIADGTGHTCVARVGGTVSCWGWNSHGQLGDGSTTDSSVPVGVTGLVL